MQFSRCNQLFLKGLQSLRNLVRFKNGITVGVDSSKRCAEPPDLESSQQGHLPAKTLNKSRKILLWTLKCRCLGAISVYAFLIVLLEASLWISLTNRYQSIQQGSEFSTNPCYDIGSNELQVILQFNIFVASDLSFGTAKTIDLLVNFIIGQGGKALHGWIAYIIFSDAITRHLEISPVSYVLYMTSKFNPTEFGSFLSYCKSIFQATSMRQRWLVFWFIWATAHVLAWPILVASATGYFSPLEPYDRLDSGFLATDTMFYGVANRAHATFPCKYKLPINVDVGPQKVIVSDLLVTIITTIDIINLTIPYLDPSSSIKDCSPQPWYDGRKVPKKDAVCVQKGGYIFGISNWMLLIIICLEIIWVSGMLGVWWDANVKGVMNKYGIKRGGVYRSALDISEAMTEDLGNQNSLHSNKELKNSLKGRNVMLGTITRPSSGNLHIRTSSKSMGRVKVYLNRLYE